MFLLFEEPVDGYEIPANAPERDTGLEQRRNWNAVTFGREYGLQLVGADFFISEATDSGPAAA